MRRVIPVLLVLSCSSATEPPHSGPSATLGDLPRMPSPRLEEVFTLATHNSYWVDRGVKNDSFASGTSERLLDQLFYDHVRSIEIDIHKDGYRVFHTVPGNSVCDDLRSCLSQVHAFHFAQPRHDPLVIVLELKELFAPNFDDTHTPEMLDAVLVDELGRYLVKPADLMQLCAGSTTLGDCLRRTRWPSFEALRGKVMVALIGNWDELGNAQSTKDWAVYAANAPNRAAFPMASPWKLDATQFTPRMQEIVSQSELDVGWSQSVFVQMEDLADAHAVDALGRGAIIRADGANSESDQDARIAKGFQYLQTDTPAVRTHDRGISYPYGPSTTAEPGTRFLIGASTSAAFAHQTGTSSNLLTTWVASGGEPRRIGCVRAAASLDDPARSSLTVCRVKMDGEHVVARIETCKSGSCMSVDATETDGGGDSVGLVFSSDSCASPHLAAATDSAGSPLWKNLASVCFDEPLTYRGLYRPAGDADAGPVLFVDTRVNQSPVSGAAFSGPLIDLSVP